MSAAGIATEQVRAFLQDYASAFERLDADAVADRYGMGVLRAALRDLRAAPVSPTVTQARLVWALHGEGDRLLNEQPKFRGVMRARG
jgi:hypothetical protein